MSRTPQESPAIFRQEAIDHYVRSRASAELLRASPVWAQWGFWGLIVVLVSGLTFGLVVTIDEYAAGPALAAPTGDEVVALLPARYAAELEAASTARFEVSGAIHELDIISVGNQTIDGSEAARLTGLPPSGSSPIVAPVLLVRAALVSGESVPPNTLGRVEVLINSQPALVALVPGLESVFGEHDG